MSLVNDDPDNYTSDTWISQDYEFLDETQSPQLNVSAFDADALPVPGTVRFRIVAGVESLSGPGSTVVALTGLYVLNSFWTGELIIEGDTPQLYTIDVPIGLQSGAYGWGWFPIFEMLGDTFVSLKI